MEYVNREERLPGMEEDLNDAKGAAKRKGAIPGKKELLVEVFCRRRDTHEIKEGQKQGNLKEEEQYV